MILTTVVAGLLAAVVFTVPAVQAAPDPDTDAPAPPSTGAEPTPAPAPDTDAPPSSTDAEPAPDAAAAAATDRCWGRHGNVLGWCTRSWGASLGVAEMFAYTNHRKRIRVCDNSRSHGIGLAVQVDPSGAQAPITYYDQNGPQNDRCFDHWIGYSVRKWKFVSVYHNGRIHDASLPWRVFPLPRPDW